jgi:hypothetical protein
MKIFFKYSNYFALVMALCIMVISGCSCGAPKPTPDPLAGFQPAALYTPETNKAITDDYKAYIQSLSSEEKNF